jgi:hypothetical protein
MTSRSYLRWGAVMFVVGYVMGITLHMQMSIIKYASPGARSACEAAAYCPLLPP